MEERLCQHCKRKTAVRTYVDPLLPLVEEEYCLDCYAQRILEEGEGESLTACPYCGTTLSEVELGKLVGCAHCYRAMQTGLLPLVRKMQGGKAHTGKTPPIEAYEQKDLPEGYRRRQIERARYERQRLELQIIIENLTAKERYEEARGYAEKLAAMNDKSTVEEDFVWRTRQISSKRR